MTTLVLIHGAYQGGWIWKRVAADLTGAGHRVLAPTLDGCAEHKGQVRAGITTETHAAEIAEHAATDVAAGSMRRGANVEAERGPLLVGAEADSWLVEADENQQM